MIGVMNKKEGENMDFSSSALPSTTKEIEYYWNLCTTESMNLKQIKIIDELVDFCESVDYFDLTEKSADAISFLGRDLGFYSQHMALSEFELNIFGDISSDTQIGGMLSNIQKKKPDSVVYCIYATFKYINKSVYCAFTIGIADEDTGMEIETAVIEFGQDEKSYINPICINADILYYYSFDDIAKISYWLANFWTGIQSKLNNYPEEVRIIDSKLLTTISEKVNYEKENNIVLIKRIDYIDKNGKMPVSQEPTKRTYKTLAWGVRGHDRYLSDGRVIKVKPYRKGKERKNPQAFVKKEYQFDKE